MDDAEWFREHRTHLNEVTEDVCRYLHEVSAGNGLVAKYHPQCHRSIHSLKVLVRIWDNTNNLKANNNALQDLVKELNDQLKIRDNEITELQQEIASLKSSGSKGGSKKGGTKSGGSAGGSGPPPPVIPPTNPHPNIVPPKTPEEWKQRVKDVTKCQTLREHCKIMCPACKWTYRGREILLQSHLGHLKTKHGGFTPSKVDGQNPYMEYIPVLVEIGVEEKRRQSVTVTAAAKAAKAQSRQARLDKFNNNRPIMWFIDP